MAIYDKNGTELSTAYDSSGNVVDYAYDKNGDTVFTRREVVFFDDFDSFDSTMWVKEIGNVRNYDTELQCYRAENVSYENSCLVLTATREEYGGKEWTSGSISGQTLQSFQYGRFEARIKFPGIAGAWGAFWMLGSNFWKGYVDGGQPTNYGVIWPKCGEVDMIETTPGNRGNAICQAWSYTGSALGSGTSETITLNNWNVYALEWTSEYMAVSVNGNEFKRWTFSDYSESAIQAYLLPMYMILNLAVGGSGGTVPDSVSTMKMYVDWVKVYAPLSE